MEFLYSYRIVNAHVDGDGHAEDLFQKLEEQWSLLSYAYLAILSVLNSGM